jgi:hypothetical protein
MPKTFQIEEIKVDKITLGNKELFINGDGEFQVGTVVFPSGESPFDIRSDVDNHLFVKGYCPLSFFSRIGMVGLSLMEVYLSESFMMTGWMVSCTTPGSGDSLQGRFYHRPYNNAILTDTIENFSLNDGDFYYSSGVTNEIGGNGIIGLDIFKAPYGIRNISINILGYFAGAGKFDRVPASIDFYENGPADLPTGFNTFSKFIQFNTNITGIKAYSNTSYSATSGHDGVNYTDYSGEFYLKSPLSTGDRVRIPNSEILIPPGSSYFSDNLNFTLSGGHILSFDCKSSLTGIRDICISLQGFYD